MLRYDDKAGTRYQGPNAAAIVRQMRAQSHAPAASLALFRQETAARAQMMTGKPVRSNTDASLIADLLTVGVLANVKEE